MTTGLDAHLAVSPGEAFTLDIELHISPGGTAALLGPNGAGKSTAVAAIAGILPLDAGHVRLDGVVLDDPANGRFVPVERRRLGIVFQDYVLFPHLSALDNVAFGLWGRGIDRATARREAGRWLERFDLAPLADRRPRDLSGGQAQRVALARALAVDPSLLLLDEPLAALDVTTRGQLRRVLAEHLDVYPGPRLLITHDPAEAFLLADTIYVIEQGRITQAGTADDIRRRPVTPYAADLAGINLMAGVATDGSLTLDNGHAVAVADRSAHGPTLATVHPRAIALYAAEPHGSPRNAWPTVITVLEPLGDRVRVQLGPPVPLTAEITPAAAAALHLAPGSRVWIAIKASEIGLQPNPTRPDEPATPERTRGRAPQDPPSCSVCPLDLVLRPGHRLELEHVGQSPPHARPGDPARRPGAGREVRLDVQVERVGPPPECRDVVGAWTDEEILVHGTPLLLASLSIQYLIDTVSKD